jgi:aminocyclitol acetyltransferase
MIAQGLILRKFSLSTEIFRLFRGGKHVKKTGFSFDKIEWQANCTLGAGVDASYIYDSLYNMIENIGIVSRDYKQSPIFRGCPVHAPDELSPEKYYVIISTSRYRKEIRNSLLCMGFNEGDDFYDWFRHLLPYGYVCGTVRVGKFSAFPWDKGILLNRISRIGAFVSIAASAQIHYNHRVGITTSELQNILLHETINRLENHDYQLRPSVNEVCIGNDLWIGANAFINVSKVKSIGNGAIIGTGAVVLDDIPHYAIALCSPAKVIKYRFTENEQTILERVSWWDWDNRTLNENAELLCDTKAFFAKFG